MGSRLVLVQIVSGTYDGFSGRLGRDGYDFLHFSLPSFLSLILAISCLDSCVVTIVLSCLL